MQHPKQFKHNYSIISCILLLGMALLATLGSGCYLSQEKGQSLDNRPQTGSNSSGQSNAGNSGIANRQKNNIPDLETSSEKHRNSRLLNLSCSQNRSSARLSFELTQIRDPRVSRANASNTLLVRFPGAKLPDTVSWEEKTSGLQMDLSLESTGRPLAFRLYHPGLRDYSSFVLPQSRIFGPRFVLNLQFDPLEKSSKDNETDSWIQNKRYAYRIKKGDYLYGILKRHKVSPAHRQKVLQRIREINSNLGDINYLQIGQILYFPEFFREVSNIRIPTVPNFESFVPTTEYKVRSGEYLEGIMRKRMGLSSELIYGQYMQLVRELNTDVENFDLLEKGQEIILPLPPQRELDKSNPHADTSGRKKKNRHKFSANFFTKNREEFKRVQSGPAGHSREAPPGNPGDFQKDIQRLQGTLKRDPENLQARLGLSRIYHQKGASQKAGYILEQGIRMNPDQVELRIRYARILIDQGSFRSALQVLEMQSPPKLKEQEDYYALLAYSRRQLAEYRKAAELYRALTLNQPGNGKWWIGWGLCLEKQGQRDRAREAYNRAVDCAEISRELKSFARERKNSLDD